MLVITVKNYISNLYNVAGKNKYEVTFKGEHTGFTYKFKIHNGIKLYVEGIDDMSMLLNIDNIDTVSFSDETLVPISLQETTFRGEDEIYEQTLINICYPAQMYTKLIRLMKERVNLLFRHDDKYYYCYYVDGKVLYIEEDDNTYVLHGTNLFHLGTTHPNYEILAVSPPLKRYRYGDYMDLQHSIARSKCKEFKQVKLENRR